MFLWQDFRYFPGHPRDKEQGLRLDEGTWNRLVEGLPTLIGVAKTDGCRADYVYDEDAAFILTGPFKLTAYKDGFVDAHETEQLACRMKYWMFNRPAPCQRDRSFKPCPRCWSRWVLDGERRWQALHGIVPDSFMRRVIAASGAGVAATPVQGPNGSTRPAPAACPAAPGAAPMGPSLQSSGANAGATFHEQLCQVMAWRTQGLLSDSEFAAAKRQLGLA